MALPKINIVYFYFKYVMNFGKKENQENVHKILPYNNTIELGRAIGFEGTMEILSFLFSGSKRYRDIEASIEIKKTTLVRQLKRLQALKIIETHEIFAEGRKTHEYAITQNGKDLLRFSKEYEKRMRIPLEQQKIIEIEKTK
jgi:DNA-binding HxlR family transcriptional regulator